MPFNLEQFHFGYMDIPVLVALCVGVVRGRKRGMSEELLDVIKWALIVVVGAYAYYPLGQIVAQNTVFSAYFSYVAVYSLIIVFFISLFSYLKPRLGDKICDSDFFGSCEFYLGMAAGAVRYACIILVLLSLLNARLYTPEEVRSEQAFQEKNFGSAFFPTVITCQSAVMEKSLTGTLARAYLTPLLIRPTHPERKGIDRQNVRARERQVQDMLDKR